MGRVVPEGVSYWTGIWQPHREAISKEVALLRAALAPSAPVVSLAAGQRASWRVADNVVCLSGNQWPVLRALAAIRERTFQLSHVVCDLNGWHLLRALGRRPMLFTVVGSGPPVPASLRSKVALFVAETNTLARQLGNCGVEPERIRVVFPGVDLNRYRPTRHPAKRFRVVFASSPTTASEIDARGIPLLVAAARLCPEMDFTFLWRQWGDRSAFERAIGALAPPANVQNVHADVADMATVYQRADATAVLSADGYGKSCPNSVVEALACGCPAVVSQSSGLADLLERSGAGLAVPRDPHAVAQALRTVRDEHAQRSAAARALAVRHFDINAFLAAYRELYQALGVQTATAPSGPAGTREARVAATEA